MIRREDFNAVYGPYFDHAYSIRHDQHNKIITPIIRGEGKDLEVMYIYFVEYDVEVDEENGYVEYYKVNEYHSKWEPLTEYRKRRLREVKKFLGDVEVIRETNKPF